MKKLASLVLFVLLTCSCTPSGDIKGKLVRFEKLGPDQLAQDTFEAVGILEGLTGKRLDEIYLVETYRDNYIRLKGRYAYQVDTYHDPKRKSFTVHLYSGTFSMFRHQVVTEEEARRLASVLDFLNGQFSEKEQIFSENYFDRSSKDRQL